VTRRPGGSRGPRPPRRRAPVPLAGAIEALTRRLEPDTALAAIQRAWPAVVGEVIAEECEPRSERGGVVTVVCRSAVWAQELTFMAPDLVARLNEALGTSRVTELRCRAA
jgi:predicted nucleic acid-binding Zn ribbon protein